MPVRAFTNNLATILLFAVIGTLFNAVTVGLSLFAVSEFGWLGESSLSITVWIKHCQKIEHYKWQNPQQKDERAFFLYKKVQDTPTPSPSSQMGEERTQSFLTKKKRKKGICGIVFGTGTFDPKSNLFLVNHHTPLIIGIQCGSCYG